MAAAGADSAAKFFAGAAGSIERSDPKRPS